MGDAVGEHETIEQRAEAEDPGYALSASSDHEHERLRRQAERFAPLTRRLSPTTSTSSRWIKSSVRMTD